MLEAIQAGTPPPSPTVGEAMIFELCAVQVLGEPGLVDVICAVGYYSTPALVMNVARTALPEGAAAPRWR